jgi:outer membrane protein assembly factor BamA
LKLTLKLLALICLLGACLNGKAQTNESKQLDLYDLSLKLFKQNPKLDIVKKVESSIVPAIGYSMHTNWAASVNANFFIRKNAAHLEDKNNTILTSFTYTINNQFMVPLQSNWWFKGNKWNINTDWRFLKYPSITYGLGARSRLTDANYIDYRYLKLHQTISHAIAKNLYAGIGLYYDYIYNIQELNPTTKLSSFTKYDSSTTEKAVGPVFKLLFDNRDNQLNATQGWFATLIFRPNLVAFGSYADWQSLLIDIRKYIRLNNHTHNVLAIWSYSWLTLNGIPPYLLLPSTGWDDTYNTGRGFIQGRYRGRNLLYLESEYRFGISKNGLFGGVIFANAQSISKEINTNIRGLAIGYGAGIRIKANKHSNTNICIDYGIGKDGSNGISVNLGEVF